MIHITLSDGTQNALNPEQIEHVEVEPGSGHTTVVTSSGHRYTVSEDLDTLIARIREWRASVMALVDYLEIKPHPVRNHEVAAPAGRYLFAVPNESLSNSSPAPSDI